MEFKKIEDIENSIDKMALNDKEKAINLLHEIIDLVPSEIRNLINFGFQANRIPKEYMLTSVLFAFSNAVGLAFGLSALGHTNFGNLFFAIVGSRGDMKSLPMKIATNALSKIDSATYKEGNGSELENIKKKKILIQNATIQAAQSSHYHNLYSIGIFLDEIMFLIEKMGNKNNSDGMAWKTFLLEGYNNSVIDILRKTTDSYRIDKSYPTLLGSIQEQFIPTLFGNGNLESGLIDRILFTTKLTENNTLSKECIPKEVIAKYENLLTNIFSLRKSIEEDEEIESVTLKLNSESEELLFQYIQNLINQQKKEDYIISAYFSKLQISIHKLIILIHAINSNNIETSINYSTVSLAIKINEFYLLNFKIINLEKDTSKRQQINLDEIIHIAIKNKATQTEVIKVFGIPKSTLSRKWNEILNNMELETKGKKAVKHSVYNA